MMMLRPEQRYGNAPAGIGAADCSGASAGRYKDPAERAGDVLKFLSPLDETVSGNGHVFFRKGGKTERKNNYSMIKEYWMRS